MKKIFISVALPLFLCAQTASIPMPPMPPMMQFPPPKSTNTTKPQKPSPKPQPKKEAKAPSTPKECELLPPMVYMLPPPMEAMLQKCKNALYFPKDKARVTKRLSLLFSNPKVLSIKAVDGFERLYKIDVQIGANTKSLFCNQYITQCIDGSLLTIGKQK